jgi:putative DNA primase/helicase
LPLGNAAGMKFPPPGGWTGHGAPYPSAADVGAWQETHGDRNIGLRMPPGVIGLDVDDYRDKTGAATLAELEARFGPLPATWVSSARPAPSGIRLYRVPTHLDGREVNWPGEAGKFIEIIQAGHRYAVVWPSTNPEADGAPYLWTHPHDDPLTGDGADRPPHPEHLAELPEAWVRGLMLSYDRAEKGNLGNEALSSWWRELRNGQPCPPVHSVLTKAVDELRNVAGARHETARDALAAIVRFGAEGHAGAPWAAQALGKAFEQAVGAERVAGGEWTRLLTGAAQLAATAEPAPRKHCEHDPASTVPEFDPAAFLAQAEAQRREQAERQQAVNRSRVEQIAAGLDALPFADRAAAVRLHMAEIAMWALPEQGYARDALTTKSGLTSLGATEFSTLLREERKQQRAAAEAAVHEAARVRHAEQVAAAVQKGELLPAPHAPIDVARALAGKMTVPARWWRGDYFLWDGTRYRQWRDEAVDHWLYSQTADAVFESADDEGGTKPWRPTETKISAVGHALSRGVLYRPSEADPDDSASQVACVNGVYDVATSTLLPHSPERFNLHSVPFAFDPDAKCPTWEWFLNDVLPADAVRLLRQWIGYLLSGRTDQEKLLHMQGLPRSGKGTTAYVVEQLLGEENIASPSIPKIVGTFGEQPLIGKTLAVMSDISWQHRDIVQAVETIKAIVGRDSRDIDRKNREAWHGRLGVRFMIMGNDLPSFKDASGALAYRMLHIRFPGTVQGREDPTLKQRLLEELPGILLWAIEGLRDLDAAGRFHEPESSRELAGEVRRQQGPVQPFIEDTCAYAAEANPVPLDELFPVYRAWARRAEVEHVLDRERFSRALTSAGLTVERKMVDGVRARRVLGIVPQVQGGRSAWVALLNPLGIVPPVP